MKSRILEAIRLYWIGLQIEALKGHHTKYEWVSVPYFIRYLCKDKFGNLLGFASIPVPSTDRWLYAHPLIVFYPYEVSQNFVNIPWQLTLEERPRQRNFIEQLIMKKIRIAAQAPDQSVDNVKLDVGTHVTFFKGSTLSNGSIANPNFRMVEDKRCILIKEGLTDDPIAVSTNDISSMDGKPYEEYSFAAQSLNEE